MPLVATSSEPLKLVRRLKVTEMSLCPPVECSRHGVQQQAADAAHHLVFTTSPGAAPRFERCYVQKARVECGHKAQWETEAKLLQDL